MEPHLAKRNLPYLQWFVQAVLLNALVDGQIYAHTPKGPAKRNLPSQAHTKHAVMRFPFDVFIEDMWVVRAFELESGTEGARTWR